MIEYDKLIKLMKPNKTISFKEYSLDRHERKHESLYIGNGIIRDVFPAGEIINLDRLKEIYGEELDIDDYTALSICMSPRYLVSVGTDDEGNDMVKMVTINKYFYETGQQEVHIEGVDDEHYKKPAVKKVEGEPNYTQAMRSFSELF